MHFLNSEIEFLDHENMYRHHSYADIDEQWISGNDITNLVISGTKPHPTPGSNTFL